MTNLNEIKQRFGILGNSVKLQRAIEIALQVAPTDISVLITGESGSGRKQCLKLYIILVIGNIQNTLL